MSTAPPGTGTRRARKRDTSALAVASALTGLLAYVVFAVTTRTLGPSDAAPVSVLWTYWSFAGAALTFPIQHWVTSTVALHGEGSVRAAGRRVALVVAGVCVVAGLLAYAGRELLFHRDDLWFPMMVVLVTAGSAVVGLSRGGLAAHERFLALGVNLVGENALRCVLIGGLALAGVDSPVPYGLALVAGSLIVVVQPRALVFHAGGSTGGNALHFLTGSGVAQLLAQVVLTGGPVLLALTGGSAAQVTAMFAALALFRAPYLLALGVVSQLNGVVARVVARGDLSPLRRLRTLIGVGTVVAAALAGAVCTLLGPPVLRLVFGPDLSFGRLEAGVVGAACVVAVGNLVCTVTVMVRGRSPRLVVAWVAGLAVAAIAFVALLGIDPTDRASVAFLVAEVVAFAVLLREQTLGAGSTAPEPRT
ncbi:MAG: hypothetical protein HOQ22_02590 [Nocardioidaceae bacterium]|nr:hypothetical protein [Nocardioidaceae bacterium]NUS49913.1 hypothetical protein [Nocardioidaceae bacterium]